jgi:tripartite-type tricarboxylate transporter receptor subunit TctC
MIEENIMNKANRLLVALSAIAMLAPPVQQAAAQDPLGKTVRIVVPNPPGGPADVLARLLADQIGRMRGPTMVVENRPGASSDIGTEAVSRAAPDGSTLLLTNINLVITKHIRPSLAFDPLTSFEPICLLVTVPGVVAVTSASPYHTLADLLADPGTLAIGAFGPASPPHIAEELLKRIARGDWTYVPFTGDAPAVAALLGEHVTAIIASYSGVMEQVASGKLRVLAVIGRERIASLPGVPTVAEYGSSIADFGYKDFDLSAWLGVLAPAHTPPDAIANLSMHFVSALEAPELNSKLLPQALYPDSTCGPAFAARLKKDYEYYGRVIRDAKIGM